MNTLRHIGVFTAIGLLMTSCGDSSNASKSSSSKTYYCQTSAEDEGGYTLSMCREYTDLTKAEQTKAISLCDKDDTGVWQDEKSCPNTSTRLGGCDAEEGGLDFVAWYYKDYTLDEAKASCTTAFEGDWKDASQTAMALR